MGKSKPDTGVILAGGGVGRRFGGPRPKQFTRLHGKTVLQWSIELFFPIRSVTEIVVVCPPRFVPYVRTLVRKMRSKKPVVVVPGGRNRQASVWNGLMALGPQADVVLVHDAVRPVVTRRVINEVIREARNAGASVAAVPVSETLKQSKGMTVVRTVDRTNLWAAHTPQGFDRELIMQAHRKGRRFRTPATDDATLVERLGRPVALVMDTSRNLKITTREDRDMVEIWLKKAKSRS